MNIVQLNGKYGQGKGVVLDDSDYKKYSADKWTAHPYGYPVRYENGEAIMMHRLIAGAKKGEFVDHIDGNPLNCTRANLRICTHAENMRNRKMAKNNTSGFKGVKKHGNNWQATIFLAGRKYTIGTFINIEDAAKAYDAKAKELHGNFARINGVA